MNDHLMTTLAETRLASLHDEADRQRLADSCGPAQDQTEADRSLVARTVAEVHRHGRNAMVAFGSFIERGQLGVSRGYPADRRPEPPF